MAHSFMRRHSLWTACTYRVVRFKVEGEIRFVAIAWEYDRAVLMSTRPHGTYTGARRELDGLAEARECTLRYFDGEYHCYGGSHGSMDKLPDAEQSAACKLENELAHSGAPFPERI